MKQTVIFFFFFLETTNCEFSLIKNKTCSCLFINKTSLDLGWIPGVCGTRRLHMSKKIV